MTFYPSNCRQVSLFFSTTRSFQAGISSSPCSWRRFECIVLSLRVPSRNWKTWNPEPRTGPSFETVFCSKPNTEKWWDDVTKSSLCTKFQENHIFGSTQNNFFETWQNLECDEMWRKTSHHLVTVPHSNPGPGSGKISAWNDPEHEQQDVLQGNDGPPDPINHVCTLGGLSKVFYLLFSTNI